MTVKPLSLVGAALFLVLPSAHARAQSASGDAPTQEVPCVAIMSAVVTGVNDNAAAASTAVRDALVTYLSGPALRPVAMEARVRLQAIEEARQKQCTHFITLTLTKKAGGRSVLGRVAGQAAGNAAWRLPGGASVGTAVARDIGISVAHELSNVAANTKARDEMQLEWTLVPIGGSGGSTSKAEKLKASADGEDLLTPLIQRSADAIVEALLKK